MSKNPKVRNSPPGNSPRIGFNNPGSTNDQTPVWSIVIFDPEGPFEKQLSGTLLNSWEDVLNKLKNFETMKWSEIERDKKNQHSVETNRLIAGAKKRLEELRLDDTESLFRFRFNGVNRLWGIREGRIFKILWWDPNHEICPSTLKNT